MKMPFRQDTTTRREAALRALAAIEIGISKLEQDRSAAIAGDADMAQILDLDHQLGNERRAAAVMRDRVAVLERQLSVQAEQQHAKGYADSVAAIDALMVPLEKIATDVELAAKQLSSAAKRYVTALETIATKWPADIPRPGVDHHGFFSARYLGTQRLGELIKAFAPPSLVRSTTHAVPPTSDYVARAITAIERLDGFADAERRNRAELVDDLTQRGVPIHHVEEEAA